MPLLALETSTEACSVALMVDGYIDSRFAVIPQQHAQQILIMLDELLRANHLKVKDFEAIVFGEGPGSFTGLRIAAGVAQGLAFAHQLPLIPISSLACLAFEALSKFPQAQFFLPALDARMQEVYFALYQNSYQELETILPAVVMKPQQMLATLADYEFHNWVGVGNGWQAVSEAREFFSPPLALLPDALPQAEYLIPLGQRAFEQGRIVGVSAALPKYVREKFL